MKLGLLFSVSDLLETYNSLSQLQLSVAVSHLSFESSQHVSFVLTKYENLSSKSPMTSKIVHGNCRLGLGERT